MTRDFIAGVIAGVVIALIWAALKKPKGTPPRGAKTQRLHDTGELDEIRRKLKVG